MRTGDECRAKATELSDLAASALDPGDRERFTRMSLTWAHLARQADWQDASPISPTYRAN